MIDWLKKTFLFKARPTHKPVVAISSLELKEFFDNRTAKGHSEDEIAQELDIPVITLRTLLLCRYE